MISDVFGGIIGEGVGIAGGIIGVNIGLWAGFVEIISGFTSVHGYHSLLDRANTR